MCMLSIIKLIYYKFSHDSASYMLNGGRLSFSDDESGALQTIQQKIARNKYMQMISNFQ